MALSFGNAAWNNASPTSGAGLSFGASVPPGSGYSMWDSFTSALPLDMGKAVGSATTTAAANGVNTTQIDGQGSFFDALAGFGSAVLSGVGVQPDNMGATAQPASWTGQQAASSGVPLETIMIVGLVGAGLYFALRK